MGGVDAVGGGVMAVSGDACIGLGPSMGVGGQGGISSH